MHKHDASRFVDPDHLKPKVCRDVSVTPEIKTLCLSFPFDGYGPLF